MSQRAGIPLAISSLQRRSGLKRIIRSSLLLTGLAIFLLGVPGLAGTSASDPIVDQCSARPGKIVQAMIPSTVYAQPVPVSVYLPSCYESTTGPLPVIYLLHGGNADETQWPDLRIQAKADALIAKGARPFVVVMPGGVYQTGIDYAAFVLNDLLPAMNDQLTIRADAAGRTIGGLSLGGYWALSIALHHSDQFAAVGGYSPVTVNDRDDLVALARTAAGLDRLRFQLDVGDADTLATGTRRLAEALEARGLAVSFRINSGGHNRPYWRSRTGDYLSFMLASFTSPTPRLSCHAEF